jgi:hypothetical protein
MVPFALAPSACAAVDCLRHLLDLQADLTPIRVSAERERALCPAGVRDKVAPTGRRYFNLGDVPGLDISAYAGFDRPALLYFGFGSRHSSLYPGIATSEK